MTSRIRNQLIMGEDGGEESPLTPIFKENIYYRDPGENPNFLGPFDEPRIQWWYRQGFFHSGMEFRMGRRGQVYRLDRLRAMNGIACPFSFLINAQSRSELEEITDRFREHRELAHQVLTMMRNENELMKTILQRMEKKLVRTIESQREMEESQKGIKEKQRTIEGRLDELEEHHVGLAERAEEWLEKLPEGDSETNHPTRDMGERDERLLEEIRRMENQIMYLNQERVRINKKVGALEESSVSMPWTRRPVANSEETQKEKEERTRREKEGRQLMWNSSQMLGHGSALVDYGPRASEAEVRALEKAVERCDVETRGEIGREWDRLVDYCNVKCMFCRCSMKNASDFVEHLINGPHLSILRWCHVSSDCLKFFTNKLKGVDPLSDQG